MKLNECIGLSWYNITTRKKTSLQIFLCFFIVGTIITSILLYSDTLRNELKSISLKNMSQSYVKIEFTNNFKDSDSDDEWTKFKKETFAVYSENLMEKLSSINNICDVQLYRNLLMSDSKNEIVNGKETEVIYDFGLTTTKLNIGGKIYSPNTNILMYETDQTKKSFAVKCVNTNHSMFSDIELSEYELKNGNKDIFLCGGELTGENQIIISEKILKLFGINPEDSEKLLGKKLSIIVNAYIGENTQEMPYIKDYTICGVLKKEYFKLSRSMTYDSLFIIPFNMEDLPDETHFFANLNAKNFADIESIKQDAEVKSGVHCETSEMLASYLLLEKQNILTNNVFIIIGSIITVAIMMFIVLLFMFTVNNKSSYFGLLKSIGMSNMNIFTVLLFEMLIIFSLSYVISSCLSYIIVSQVLNIIADISGMVIINITFESVVNALLESFSLTVVLIIIMTLVVSFNIRKTNATDLLKV
ncbi:MAG: hypothetical protein PUG48_04050 [Clostridia bacterium]|nr:hypothetical protein [Clostridia bacterium]